MIAGFLAMHPQPHTDSECFLEDPECMECLTYMGVSGEEGYMYNIGSRVSREYGMYYLGIKFPYFLVTTNKLMSAVYSQILIGGMPTRYSYVLRTLNPKP